MQGLDHFAVHGARRDVLVLPDLLPSLGSSSRELAVPLVAAEVHQHGLAEFFGDLLFGLAVQLDTVQFGPLAELLLVRDLVSLGLALPGLEQELSGRPAVVRVSGASGRDHSEEVAGRNRVCVCAADPELGFVAEGIDDARSHVADLAADAELAEAALRHLLLEAVPGCLNIAFREDLRESFALTFF